MKSLIVLLNIISAILLSSCKDHGTGPSLSTGFSVKVTIKNPSGAPVSGLRISAWNRLPAGILRKSLMNNGSLAPLSASVVNFSTATTARINLTVFEIDRSPASTLVDQVLSPGVYAVHWNNTSHTPPRVYYYRLVAQDTGSSAQLFRDSLFAVLWHTDPEIAILGWSSSAGIFETGDTLLFPNVLNLPPLIRTSSQGPESLGTFTIPDSITIALTDTVTKGQMMFDRVIRRGVANNIDLVWNPPLPGKRAQSLLPIVEQQSIPGITRTAAVPFDWKLYQNYPNPYN